MSFTIRSMSNEAIGTFIDAIYAIAITLLSLTVPDQIHSSSDFEGFASVLTEYAVAFSLLFVFWLDHRRLNSYIESYGRPMLFFLATGLMAACLIPAATALVFRHGDDVTVSVLRKTLSGQSSWSLAEVVDLFYLAVVLGADWSFLMIARLGLRGADGPAATIRFSKHVASLALFVLAGLSLLLPVKNRYFVLVLPLVMFAEQELLLLVRGRFAKA